MVVGLTGLSFVFSKATQGLHFVDPEYIGHVTNTTAQGAVAGSYHFLEAGDGAKQCDVFLTNDLRLSTSPDLKVEVLP